MKKVFFLFFLSINASGVFSQILLTAADTQALLVEIPFPQASATMILSFSSKMLDIKKMPEKEKSATALESLLKKYEEEKKDVQLLMDIYYAYDRKQDPQSGMPYLQRAYGLAMELYELNPSNLELLDKITAMMIAVKRQPDIIGLWKDYTERNPTVAKGWASLAIYQAQVFDTLGCKLSLHKAFELNPEESEIYVAALIDVGYKLLMKLQAESDISTIKADLSFYEMALASNSNSEFVKTAYNTAKLIEIFYTVLLSNIDQFSGDKSFKLELTDIQKIEWAELEKEFKRQLKDDKIINKYMMLKGLLVLEVLRSEPDLGKVYLEEAVKIIDTDADLYKILSFGYMPLRKYQNAIPPLKKATEILSNYDDMFALAKLYFENHETDKSMEVLELLLQTYPEKTDIVMGIISCMLKDAKFKDACATLFRLQNIYEADIDIENTDPYFLFYKAVCILVFTENKGEAKKALQAVIDKELPWSFEAALLLKKFF